jgi:hypothetical protein
MFPLPEHSADDTPTTIRMRVSALSVPASSVESKKKVVRTITKADTTSVNRSIEPKIRQNASERIAWWMPGFT